MAREDATADIARELDLPEEPEEEFRRKRPPPVVGEAGGSNWCAGPEAPIFPEASALLVLKDEAIFYDDEAGARKLQAAMQGVMMAQKNNRRAKKVTKPDSPGSTLSTADSPRDLKARFGFSEAVTLRLPTPSERADNPPKGFFTLYEGFFYFCFLCFPIPRAIMEYLWSYKLALAQITTRGLRHLIGVIVRGDRP